MRMNNEVRLFGSLGADPEVKELQNTKIAKFDLAINESYQNKNGDKSTKTFWIRVVAFNSFADVVIKHLKKGDSALILGRLSIKNYEDAEGIKKYTTEIILNEFIALKKNPQPYKNETESNS